MFVAGSSPSSDGYRDALLATSGLVDYWRMGELSGASSSDETSATAGSFAGRFVLGQPGVLGALRNTSASFDGASGELSMPGSDLGANATMEGWFRWRAGTTVLRDSTDMGGEGWMPAFATAGNLAYRLGGQGFNTGLPIGTVRDGEWHHVVATKSGDAGALYIDGQEVHSSTTGAGSQLAVGPWHVMRNGTNAVFSNGEADEIALYTRALGASEVQAHYDLARDLADRCRARRPRRPPAGAAAGRHRPGRRRAGRGSPAAASRPLAPRACGAAPSSSAERRACGTP